MMAGAGIRKNLENENIKNKIEKKTPSMADRAQIEPNLFEKHLLV